MNKFYSTALSNEVIKTRLSKFRIIQTELEASQQNIEKMEELRRVYLHESAESQETTQIKDKAMDELDIWMDDFFIAAEIALEHKPQLLESLGIKVKN